MNMKLKEENENLKTQKDKFKKNLIKIEID